MHAERFFAKGKGHLSDMVISGGHPVGSGPFLRAGIILLTLLTTAGWQAASQVTSESSSRTYIFKGDHAYPPFEYVEGGRMTGFNVELLQAVAEAAHLDIRIELGPWDLVRREFAEGKIDGLTGFYQTAERAVFAGFAVPFLDTSLSFFTRDNARVKTLDDARDGEILVQSGDVAHDYLVAQGFKNIKESHSPAEALRLLAGGEGAGALMEHSQGVYLCQQMGLSNIVPAEQEILKIKYAFAVDKGNAELLGKLNDGYQQVLVNGEFGRIWLRWFKKTLVQESAEGFSPIYIFSVLLAITLLLMFLALWGYLLRREVDRRTTALRTSEERYRTLFSSGSDALFLLRERVFDCNQQACELLGLTREELIGLSPDQFSTPFQLDGRDSASAAREYIAAALAGRPQLFQWVHKHKNGERIDVEVSLCAIPGLEEAACLAAVRDISPRIKAEQAVRRQRDLTRVIMETSPMGVITFDAEGTITFANAQLERILRLNRAAICGRSHADILWGIQDADGKPFVKDDMPFLVILRNGTPIYDFRFSLLRSSGERIIVSCNGAPILSEEGVVRGVVATMEDITIRVEADREREDRWVRIQKQQEAIIRIGRDPAMVEGDFPAVAQVIVSLAAEVLKVSFSSLWLLDEGMTQLRCVASSGSEPASETRVLHVAEIPAYMEALEAGRHVDAPDARHDPRTMHLIQNYLEPNKIGALLDAPIRFGGKLSGVLCNEHHGDPRYWRPDEVHFATELADQASQALAVEERRAFEARMQQSQKLESLGILAGGLAHDFNNLLTAIMGNVDLAMMDIPEENSATASLKEIKGLSTRAAELCRSMLAYAGKGKFLIRPILLNEEIREIGCILASSIPGNIRLVYKFEESLPPIDADKGQIQQVIMNLMLNASEAIGGKEGSVTVRTYVVEGEGDLPSDDYVTDRLCAGPYVALEVSDTGVGMEREVLEKIFNPFFSTKFVGRGMGLSGVLGIVRGHKGCIRVHSTPGRGSVFTVLMPGSTAGVVAVPGDKNASVEQGGSAGVLLVDANKASQRITAKILGRLGYVVMVASDLNDAAVLFSKERGVVRCIIVDHAPNYVFSEAHIMRLCRQCDGVPLLMATDLDEHDAARLYGNLGFSGFLQKPFRVATLAARLSSLIER